MVKTTKCLDEGDECGTNAFGSFPTKCKQSYADVKLWTLSKSGRKLELDTFSVASSCICHKICDGILDCYR